MKSQNGVHDPETSWIGQLRPPNRRLRTVRSIAAVSRQKVIYEILRSDTGEVLGQHRTRQAAVDGWRRWTGVPCPYRSLAEAI